MPLALLLIGLLLITTGIKGNVPKLGAQLEADLLGTGGNAGFLTWFGALFILGCLGYVPVLQKPARMLMVLIIVVMVFRSDTGIFANLGGAFTLAERAGPIPSTPLPQPGALTGGASSGGSGSSNNGIGDLIGAATTIASLF
jgi:hypothetical protein